MTSLAILHCDAEPTSAPDGHEHLGERRIRNALASMRRHFGVDAHFISQPDGRVLSVASGPRAVGRYSIPVVLSDGTEAGSLHSDDAHRSDLEATLATMALVLASQLDSTLAEANAAQRSVDETRTLIMGALPEIVYQPVFDLRGGRMIGAEALSRFPGCPRKTPDIWFSEAEDVGLGIELARAVIVKALETFRPAFEKTALCLGLNVSPDVVTGLPLRNLIGMDVGRRIHLEITEHDRVDDYAALADALEPLRDIGVKVNVDDMGAGFANIAHVLKIAPDVIKIDAAIVQGIDNDAMKHAWMSGIMEFSRRGGCFVLAEGIETPGELEVLRELGVHYGQGFLLGRPMDVSDLIVAADQVMAAA